MAVSLGTKRRCDPGTEGKWLPTWFAEALDPDTQLQWRLGLEARAAGMLHGKLATPIMTPALPMIRWAPFSVERFQLWKPELEFIYCLIYLR